MALLTAERTLVDEKGCSEDMVQVLPGGRVKLHRACCAGLYLTTVRSGLPPALRYHGRTMNKPDISAAGDHFLIGLRPTPELHERDRALLADLRPAGVVLFKSNF